jgi:hypothetical protein
MKGKTALSLAIVLSMLLAALPLMAVRAQTTTMEIVFENGLHDIQKAFGSTFVVTLKIVTTPPITQWAASISWDPAVLEIVDPDNDIVEGPFLKNVGSTMFAVKPLQPGLIPEMFSMLMVAKTASGTGDLAYITFHALGYGDTSVHIDMCSLLNGLVVVSCDPVHGVVHVPPPPATPPKAIFTPAQGQIVYVCESVTLDATQSTAGTDTLPAAHSCPITEYKWDIDFRNGTIETLYGKVIQDAFHCDGPGDVDITLTVTAPDPESPTSPDYVPTASETHTIHQITKPVGPSIDVYTDRGGEGPGYDPTGTPYPFPTDWSDAYGPQEQVILYAKVTYNDEPVEYKPVAFEAIDANGVSRDYRTAFTDANGIATAEFRIPWEGSAAEALFGDWSIIGSVFVSGEQVSDICKFKFGYIVSIREITVIGSPLKKGDSLGIDLNLQSISYNPKDVMLTIVLYDECSVPIGLATSAFTVDPEDGIASGFSITIPSWAFVGTGKVYANVFTDYPSAGGVPMCPERSAIFIIQKT